MPQVTIRDVANEAGLAVSSVSRILRGGQGHVYPRETQDRVREVADRLGYRANAAARLLRQSSRTLIGMSVHHTEHPHLNKFLVVVREGLLARGYDPVVFESQQLAGAENEQCFPPVHMLAGLINLGIDLEHGWPQHYDEMRRRLPIVAIQAVSRAAASHVDVVHVDYESAFRQGLAHLISLGHSRIAYLGPDKAFTPIDIYKFKAWKKAAKAAGHNPNYYIPWHIERTKAQARNPKQMDDMMSQVRIQQAVTDAAAAIAEMNPRPSGIICASDEAAICLQSYLLTQGWILPKDLSIVGYDGISFGALVFPALTTIEPDYTQMADAAICRLLQLIALEESGEKDETREWFVQPHLIKRKSTAQLNVPLQSVG